MISMLTSLLRRFVPSVYVVTTFDDDRVKTQTVYVREAVAWVAYRTACDLARACSDPAPCFASRAVLV